MDFQTDDNYDIVPEFNGNDKNDVPATFHCRYLTAPERDRVFKEEVVTGVENYVRVTCNRSLLFRLSITSIDDCKIKGRVIKTVEQYNEARMPSGLYDELINKMIAENRRDDLKNS